MYKEQPYYTYVHGSAQQASSCSQRHWQCEQGRISAAAGGDPDTCRSTSHLNKRQSGNEFLIIDVDTVFEYWCPLLYYIILVGPQAHHKGHLWAKNN